MKNQKPTLYITTPLYYPNSDLHLGHCYSTVIADVISRYEKLRKQKVVFITGVDEHGKKVYEKALNEKTPIRSFLKQKIVLIKKL
jgi:methionyl-tRNA synthetase